MKRLIALLAAIGFATTLLVTAAIGHSPEPSPASRAAAHL